MPDLGITKPAQIMPEKSLNQQPVVSNFLNKTPRKNNMIQVQSPRSKAATPLFVRKVRSNDRLHVETRPAKIADSSSIKFGSGMSPRIA